MEDPIKSIANKSIREWYQRNLDPLFLRKLVEEAEKEGYSFDTNSGLLFRKVYSDSVIKRLGYTVLDIIFPRHTDLHYHKDVDEAIKVVKGEGFAYVEDEDYVSIEVIHQGSEIYIPKKTLHLFSPFENNCLEIRLACSGIFDPKQEVCVEKFEKLGMETKVLEEFLKREKKKGIFHLKWEKQ